jgi:hypothetical protein
MDMKHGCLYFYFAEVPTFTNKLATAASDSYTDPCPFPATAFAFIEIRLREYDVLKSWSKDESTAVPAEQVSTLQAAPADDG